MILDINKAIANLLNQIKQDEGLRIFVCEFTQQIKIQYANKKAKLYVVGGAVRDAILDIPNKDFDFVVEGLSKEEVWQCLSKCSGKTVDAQSRNFGVYKFRPQIYADNNFNDHPEIDIALPRLDIYSQYGGSHTDVTVSTDEKLTIADDLSRRDFTINAMAVEISADLSDGKLIDLYNGVDDLSNKIIKAVGDPIKRLCDEDPTRMVRAIRFACKYDFTIEPKTYETIDIHKSEITKPSQLNPEESRVSKESIASEFLKSFFHQPVRTISLIDQLGLHRILLSAELAGIWDKLKTTEQPINYHAEGNVWNHTMIALGNRYKLQNKPFGLTNILDNNILLAVFLHDFGKVETIKPDGEGGFTYYGHPDRSAELAIQFINELCLVSPFAKNSQYAIDPDKIAFIIRYHMLPCNTNPDMMRDGTILKYFFFENKDVGQQLLQMAFLDASSAIIENQDLGKKVLQRAYDNTQINYPEEQRQFFTNIIRFIKRIDRLHDNMGKYLPAKDRYPLNGHEIMELLSQINIESLNHIETKNIINDIVNNKKGHPIIGEIQEIILDDALVHKEYYYQEDQTSDSNKLSFSKRAERANIIINKYLALDFTMIQKILIDYIASHSHYDLENNKRTLLLVKKIFLEQSIGQPDMDIYSQDTIDFNIDQILANSITK